MHLIIDRLSCLIEPISGQDTRQAIPLKQKRQPRGCRIFRLVDYYDKLSNLLEDLLTLDQFVESIESELDGN